MQFSIRDILFVIVICGLIVGWYLDSRRHLKELEQFKNESEERERQLRKFAAILDKQLSDLKAIQTKTPSNPIEQHLGNSSQSQ